MDSNEKNAAHPLLNGNLTSLSEHSQNGSSNGHSNGHPEGVAARNGYPDVFTVAVESGELHPKHRAMLESESAISPDAIEARGYFTASDSGALSLLGFARSQQRPPALVIPLWNFRGERQGYALRPDIPRSDGKTGKAIKYEIPKDAPPTLDVSPLTVEQIGDVAKPLLITEGAKKADAAASRGLCALNLNGVWGFQSKGRPLPDWREIPLRGRVVFVAYDSDVAQKRGVELAMRRLHALLQGQGATVKVIYLPDGKDGSKTGLDDYFARGGSVEQLWTFARDLESVEESARKRREAENAAKLEALKAGGLPLIETNGRQQQDELDDLSHAIEAFNAKHPTLFHGAAGLALIERDARGLPVIRRAVRESVQCVAGKAAKWIRTGQREGVVNVAPPRELCAIFGVSQCDWRGIPPLEGVVTAPFFAPDGTLCAQTGYHRAARLWLELPRGFSVGDTAPTPENVEAALHLILGDILGEVAFADEASRAHAVALMVLPFVRHMIQGPTPLHLFDAPLRGSGKSYAAQLCTLPFGEIAPTPEKANQEEWRKSLLSLLFSGPSHVFLDNIKGALNSSTLDAAITGDAIQDRATGTGETLTARVRCVWVATANNAQLTEDAATRAIVIRLDANRENPDAREFAGDPKAFIRENRGRVCGAVLTLVRAWQDAGSPAYAGPNRCRFPQWANLAGGLLEVAGIGGFLDNLDAQREALSGGDGDEWARLAALWLEKHGEEFVSTKEVLALLGNLPDLAAQIGGDSDKGEKSNAPPSARKLGMALHKRRDRIFAGIKIEAGLKVNNQRLYRTKKMA